MEEKAFQVIEQMADQLGVTATYLWGVLVAQAPIQATIYLLQMVVVGVLFYVSLHVLLKYSKKYYIAEEDSNADEDRYIPILVASGFSFVVFLVVGIAVLLDGIRVVTIGYTNPEYWALTQILDKF